MAEKLCQKLGGGTNGAEILCCNTSLGYPLIDIYTFTENCKEVFLIVSVCRMGSTGTTEPEQYITHSLLNFNGSYTLEYDSTPLIYSNSGYRSFVYKLSNVNSGTIIKTWGSANEAEFIQIIKSK